MLKITNSHAEYAKSSTSLYQSPLQNTILNQFRLPPILTTDFIIYLFVVYLTTLSVAQTV
jgi:hypothetical protein